MLWIHSSLAMLLAFTADGAVSAQSDLRVPVVLRLEGDDGLSQELQVQLEEAIKKDHRIRLAVGRDDKTLTIQTDSNVDWGELDGRKVAIVTAYVFATGEIRPRSTVTACWRNNMSKCVKEIVRVARIHASDMR